MYCVKMADYTFLVFNTHVRDLYLERSLRLCDNWRMWLQVFMCICSSIIKC